MQGPDGTSEETETRSILFLCGIKHSGKSTLGRRLADHRGLPFYDGDDLTLAEANRMSAANPAGEMVPDAANSAGEDTAPGAANPAGEMVPEVPFRRARDLYRAVGPEEFKELEAVALERLIEAEGRSPGGSFRAPNLAPRIVVALGGGVADNPDALDLISRSGYLVYLHVDAHILYERIMRRGTPAFLTTTRPWEEFEKLYMRRDAAYRSASDVAVELTGLGIAEALKKVDTELRRHLSGW